MYLTLLDIVRTDQINRAEYLELQYTIRNTRIEDYTNIWSGTISFGKTKIWLSGTIVTGCFPTMTQCKGVITLRVASSVTVGITVRIEK